MNIPRKMDSVPIIFDVVNDSDRRKYESNRRNRSLTLPIGLAIEISSI
jgi:hypothetical protein